MSRLALNCTISTLFAVLSACSQPLEYQLSPVAFECKEMDCDVTFDIQSFSENELSLTYKATLNQNFIRDPEKQGIVDVGAAQGEISLQPGEAVTVSRTIAVTILPNGAKVAIYP